MSLFKNPPVDVGKTIQVAATINRQPFMLVVDAKSPYKTVAELTAAMKQKGDKATYAAAAPTGTHHGRDLQGDRRQGGRGRTTGTPPDSLNDMLSGAVDYGMHDPVFALAQQREGRLRILAVSTGKRLDANPDMPTMTESGVPMDLTGWWAVMVPTGTPQPVVDQINKWFVQIVGSAGHQGVPQQVRRRSADRNAGPGPGAVPQGHQGVGRLRQDREDRAAMISKNERKCIAARHVPQVRLIGARPGYFPANS